jgi:lipopolysaccharide biosynthesis glycosyltransferase
LKTGNNNINIVVTIDENYVQHCATMLTSLFVNNKHLDFTIYIIYSAISIKNLNLIQKEIERNKAQVQYIEINTQLLNDAYISHHISIATYFRLLIPNLLPQSINKVLFLDSDLIVRKPIDGLWNINISDFSHAAVENPRITEHFKINLGMKPNSLYFNAGVLLINLDYWRKNFISDKSIDFLNNNRDKITLWDQDVLNYVLKNMWYVAPSHWNSQEAFFKVSYSNNEFNVSESEYHEIRNDPSIVHFTGSDKPWFKEHIHPFKQEYYKYLALTYWKKFKPISRKPTIIQRLYRKILRGVNYFRII